MVARPAYVEIRASDAISIVRIPLGPDLQQMAMRWNYIVRQRNRWAQDNDRRQRQAERLKVELAKVGVKTSHLRRMAQCGIIEVSVPFYSEAEGWEARVMPWEYVLTAATAEYRGDQRLLVVRHLQRAGRQARRRQMNKLAIVEAAPGAFREQYDFSAEKRLMRSMLSDTATVEIIDPTRDGLQRAMREVEPDVVHWTGIDLQLGRKLLGSDSNQLSKIKDGVFLSGEVGEPVEVNAVELSTLLCAGTRKPELVGFHVWDSGSRLAPLVVAEGANAAVGFEHTSDDAVAEQFFVHFYRACIANDLNYLTAFLVAWTALAPYAESVRGSSIILWSARSLVGADYEGFEKLADTAQAARARRVENTQKTREADPKQDRAAELLEVSLKPKRHLNYSLLHNGGNLLEEFVVRFVPQELSKDINESSSDSSTGITATAVGQIRDVHVTVELHVGTASFPYRTAIKIGQLNERIDLAANVRLPLTSTLFRDLNERTQTSLYAQVQWHDQVIYRDTHSVWLAPLDEWSLIDEDICWLPSFVQPRDPAVAEIIHSAQNFLQCLADSGSAGFDGYQSYAPSERRDKWLGVDRQVQAIWSALVFARRLHYINPPPSYINAMQRLRTPHQTIQQQRGTCIDLALLFASCLEWIEVYPVIFLLQDHAFPGYWKSSEAYQRFFDVRADLGDSADEIDLGKATKPGMPWVADRSSYQEIKKFVDNGELIPLESVLITSVGGFREAIARGRDYFAKRMNIEFHSMVDIFSSREVVTPIPL